MVNTPPPHASGARPPQIPADLVPQHIAVVMDGNGRWAKERGLPRTAGHEAGEASLMDCIYGSLELGVKSLSAYAFSTENWRRSPEEVRFLMNFNRDVIRRRRDQMNDLGVRIRWALREKSLLVCLIPTRPPRRPWRNIWMNLICQMLISLFARVESKDSAISCYGKVHTLKWFSCQHSGQILIDAICGMPAKFMLREIVGMGEQSLTNCRVISED